ncbi:nucleotidyltransferase family protein [uncultured Bacteroides sp.]|uniref:nucleotidyltransferase domain-containing protein n=1 Tax=uncultured Bacteroides sp. TaxID=162156 RepID=UPI002AA77014|nr:nucleotidyltransferase family protein [uncultured Bacteroides sp.]
MKRTFHETVLFDLLKISLWNQGAIINYANLAEEDWKAIYQLAAEQGVQSLVFDSIIQLPEKWRPEDTLLLMWAANTKLQEQRFMRNVMATNQLNEIFKAQELEILLLKGVGLAIFYPNLLYREFGDIDIYTNDHKKADNILLQYGEQTREHPKHNVFKFKGIPVENHRNFITLIKGTDLFSRKRRKAFETVEKELHDILKDEGSFLFRTYDNLRVPSATFNFLFLLMHTGTHLGGELVMRHLCDWACFLSTNQGRYNEKRIETTLGLLNFRKICFLMTDTAIRYLGMPPEFAPSFYRKESRARLNERFMNSLFHRFPGSKEVRKNTLWCKWRRFYSKQWKYDLLYCEYLPERLVRTLILWYQGYKGRMFK